MQKDIISFSGVITESGMCIASWCARRYTSIVSAASGIICDCRRAFAFLTDHQTSQFFFHTVVLYGIDERVYAGVEIGHEYRWILADI